MAELEPVSWLAILLVEERLQGVTVHAGYRTDLASGTISTDPSKKAKDDAGIYTLISAGTVADDAKASGRRLKVSEMDVTIEVTVPFAGEGNPALIAHRARADVVRAIAGGVIQAPEGIRSLEITGSSFDIGITADGAAVVIAQVTARAGLAESTPPAT